jgi:hypothetical protein
MTIQDEEGDLASLAADFLHESSLPMNWTFTQGIEGGLLAFKNTETGEVTSVHPAIDYYRGVLWMYRGCLARLIENMQSDPPTPKEINEMETFLGISGDDSPLVREVPLLACCAPLPEGFVEVEGSAGTTLFRCSLNDRLMSKNLASFCFGE